jgi:hypothetical protein
VAKDVVLEVAPLVIALAATIVGIVGNTWDKRKRGWRKLTTTGRLVVILAIASFGVSAYQARQAAHVREDQARKEDLLRALAREDVVQAIEQLVDPFERVIDQDEAADVIDRRLYRAIDHLDKMGSENFLQVLDKVPALGCPPELRSDPGCTWARMLGIAAARGDDRLKDVQERYSGVLTPQALELIQSVRSHKMIGILKSAPGNIEMNQELGKDDLGEMTVGWLLRGPHEPSDYYLPFFSLLQQVRDEVGRKREEPDQWWLEKPMK